MRVLFVSSEVYPLIKTGGLADVSGALPAALQGLGIDARVLMPAYPQAKAAVRDPQVIADFGSPLGVADVRLIEAHIAETNVRVWLLDAPELFERDGGPYQRPDGADWEDNGLRFGLLGWTAATLCQEWSPLDWRPDVLHANDWQAGLAPAYLQAWAARRPPSVLTIHNIAYQGTFEPDLVDRLELPMAMYAIDGFEYYGRMSFLKAGCIYSDKLTTVSPTYAREIQTPAAGMGLQGVLAMRGADLVGILNGVDYGVWDPRHDPYVPVHYGADLAGKDAAKRALQEELGLAAEPQTPLLAVVSRLNDHKGMDLVLAAMPFILQQGAQLALLGSGDRWMEEGFEAVARQQGGRVAARIGYDEGLAHRIIAGADLLLMPSRAEPCGLTQLYALRYGTIPLVHETGGLADTVVDATYDTLLDRSATGFVFRHADEGGLQWCIDRAMTVYRSHPEQWRTIRGAGPRQDFSWRRSAQKYYELYEAITRT